jgi:hypothetical protein
MKEFLKMKEHEERIQNAMMAFQLAGFKADAHGTDKIISIYELIREKKGKVTLDQISDVIVQAGMRNKSREQQPQHYKMEAKLPEKPQHYKMEDKLPEK